MDKSFWKEKRVFVTSPASFLGAWTCLTLLDLGAQVFGFGEAATTTPHLFDLSNLAQRISMTFGDLRDETALQEALDFAQADVVLHLGEAGALYDAQRNSYEFVSKNVLGTTRLLELLRQTASVRSVVVLSSDKVYEKNLESSLLSENAAVGASQGFVPAVRLCSELIALSYRQTYFSPDKYNRHKIALAVARMGSCYGGGDFEERSLVRELVMAGLQGTQVEVRNPQSVRPWMHVSDQVEALLILAQRLIEKGPKLKSVYNFGPSSSASVLEVMNLVAQHFNQPEQELEKISAESRHGQLLTDAAQSDLGWQVTLTLNEGLKKTCNWYQSWFKR